MHRHPALFLFVPFEHREIEHPQRPPARFEVTVLVPDFHAERPQRFVHDLGAIGAEEN
ncbi:hypothetical protein D3C83_25950 [compost metagenome]